MDAVDEVLRGVTEPTATTWGASPAEIANARAAEQMMGGPARPRARPAD